MQQNSHGDGRDKAEQDLEVLLARFRAPLQRFFRKRAFDRQEAEDLVQEVFCRLAARTEGLRLENPEAYVFQIAANLLRDRARQDIVRKEAVREYAGLTGNSFEEISPERVLQGRQGLAELQRALAELPERTRAIFLLQRYEGFTYKEIGIRLQVSTSLVEKHMMDAIKHLAFRVGRQ